MKSLSQLLSPLMVGEIIVSDDKIITDVVSDSRKVTTGSLFVAVRGTTVDGHSFIPCFSTAVTAGTNHGDDGATVAYHLAYSLKHVDNGIGSVGIVDNRCIAPGRVESLEASGHGH